MYTKFCGTCKNILTGEEMDGSICNRCKEEQIAEMKRHAETFKERLDTLAEEET